MARRWISRAEASRLAGVSDVAISKASKGKLAPACAPDGKMIDADHPAFIAYLESKGRKPMTPGAAPVELAPPGDSRRRRKDREQKNPPPRARRSDPDPTELDPEEERELDSVDLSDSGEPTDDWPLRLITDKFGTHTKFIRWLDARKKLADIKEKDLKNEETEGKLIERELVQTHLVGLIDSVFRRLLSDSPKTLARKIYALANSGRPVEEAEKVVRDDLSSQLGPLKARAAQVLRDA